MTYLDDMEFIQQFYQQLNNSEVFGKDVTSILEDLRLTLIKNQPQDLEQFFSSLMYKILTEVVSSVQHLSSKLCTAWDGCVPL